MVVGRIVGVRSTGLHCARIECIPRIISPKITKATFPILNPCSCNSMSSNANSHPYRARLVYGAVLVALALVIAAVYMNHRAGKPDQSTGASAGPAGTKDIVAQSAASGSAAPASSPNGKAASAATEPPNPFKAMLEGHPSRAAPPPPAASAQPDPFKAFLETGQSSGAAPQPAAPNPPDAQNPQEPVQDPFKEALERANPNSQR